MGGGHIEFNVWHIVGFRTIRSASAISFSFVKCRLTTYGYMLLNAMWSLRLRPVNVVTSTSQCGHFDQSMWSLRPVNVVTSTSQCGHFDQSMWSLRLVNVVTSTSQCGHFDQSMWSLRPVNVVTSTSQCGHFD